MLSKNKVIELKERKTKRTIKQNSYLHVIISLFSINIGYTLEEAKTHLKRHCNFMIYKKGGESFLKSTAVLDTKELTDFIEWIRNYSSENGFYLPSPEEYIENQVYINQEIERHKEYL